MNALNKRLIQHRRYLHQIPELSHELPKTKAYILSILTTLHCQIIEPAPCAICAYFSFDKDTTLAFRSDMDALEIQEQTNLPYQSIHAENMHACGHDAHMAILLEFAQEIDSFKSCAHNVLLIFQPAEETTGGAKEIIDSGIFQRFHVSAIFGIHVWPKLTEGQIATKANAMMARSSEVTIKIHGTSNHVANSEMCKDALACGIEFVHCLYQKEALIQKDHLMKFGQFQSGTTGNVISAYTFIKGTLRTFDDATFAQLKQIIYETAAELSQKTDCEIDIHIGQGYPPLINDPALVQQCMTHIPELQLLPHANLLSEDFSYYGLVCPSVFFYLGIGDTLPLHSDHFQFDDAILMAGVSLYHQLLTLKPEDFAKISSRL